MTEEERRIEKFKRRAPMIATQAHLDKILATFPEEKHAALLEQVMPLLNLKDKNES